MTRHDALVAELEARGWLAGEWHQHHHRTHVALEFAPGMTVHAVPDIPARTLVKKVVMAHPTDPTQKVWGTVREEHPLIKGDEYEVRCGNQLPQRVKTAREAVDLMEKWRAQLLH